MTSGKLAGKQARFVEEYLIDLNATAAYRRAGYRARGNSAEASAAKLLRHHKVAAAIAEAQSARSERTEITADMVLQHWWDIATADANQLIQLRRVCCRNCYGIDFEYQWVDAKEFNQALKLAAMVENADPRNFPTDEGGYGFNRTLVPHRDCPQCFGEGHEQPFVHDTRQLRGAAKLLYAGVKVTRDGIEIKMRDQDKAMENVAKHLGMFKEKIEVDAGENLAALIAARRARAMGRSRSEEETQRDEQ